MQRFDAVELVEAVNDDVANSGSHRLAQLVDALVVAVHDAGGGGDTGVEDDVQLAAAGDVEEQPFIVDETGYRTAEERLGGIDHTSGAERLHRLPAAFADVSGVVDEQRRAELAGEVEQRAAADCKRPVRADHRRVREQP